MTDDQPTGLLGVSRSALLRLVLLYAALTIVLVAVPALIAQRRDPPPHLTRQDTTTGRAR